MRILTLFLAFLLTLLPDGATHEPFSSVQEDVCVEEVVDVEEDAVIRSQQRVQKTFLLSFFSFDSCRDRDYHRPHYYLSSPFCFEKQWLTHCRLRL